MSFVKSKPKLKTALFLILIKFIIIIIIVSRVNIIQHRGWPNELKVLNSTMLIKWKYVELVCVVCPTSLANPNLFTYLFLLQ